jgi:hypothetical protein
VAFKTTLGTGESKTFADLAEAQKWLRDHYVSPEEKEEGGKLVFTQAVKQVDSSVKIENIGTIEKV